METNIIFTNVLGIITGMLSSLFYDIAKGEVEKRKLNAAIRAEAESFSRHKIWSDLREQGIKNVDRILQREIRILAYDVIECNKLSNRQKYDQQMKYVLDKWLAMSGVKSLNDKEKATEIFYLFSNSILRICEQCFRDNDILLHAMLQRSIDETIKGYTIEIFEQIESNGSIKKFVDNMKSSLEITRDSIFDYRSKKVPFCGRHEEFRKLFDFCESDRQICWWAVVGPGGAGKSRLALEFCKILVGPKWECLFLNQVILGKLIKEVNKWSYSRNLFIVVDYASLISNEVGAWIRTLELTKLPKEQKIRILILERNGFNEENEPLWFKNMCWGFGPGLDSYRYAEQKQLDISNLSEVDQKEIITYIVQNNHHAISDEDIQRMIELLIDIDPEGKRPLFLLFILQTYLDDPKSSWRQWKRDELQKYIYQREIYRIDSIVGDDKLDRDRAKMLWSFATLVGPCNINSIQNISCLHCNNALLNQRGDTIDNIRLIMKEVCENGENDITPYEPDLVGELFILETLKGKDKEVIDEFLEEAWKINSRNVAYTLFRAFIDYGEDDKYSQLIGSGGGCIIEYIPKVDKGNNIIFYAALLAACSVNAEMNKMVKIVKRLWDLLKQYDTYELIAEFLASVLVDLTTKQDQNSRRDTVEALRELLSWYEENVTIAEQYAQGLIVLSEEQDQHGKQDMVVTLRELLNRYEGNGVIAELYAEGLIILSRKQDQHGKQDTVEALRELLNQYEGNAVIAKLYAEGLSDLCSELDQRDRQDTVVEALRELMNRYEGDFAIAAQYARGLIILSKEQDQHGKQDMVEALRELLDRYEGNAVVAELYADGLIVLSKKQDQYGKQDIVEALRELLNRYEGNAGIAVLYAESLVDLCIVLDQRDKQNTVVETLRELINRYEGNFAIARRYALGLFVLCKEFDQRGSQDMVEAFRELWNQYTESTEIAMYYSFSLYALCETQDQNDKQYTVEALRELLNRYDGNVVIEKQYHQGVIILDKMQYKIQDKINLNNIQYNIETRLLTDTLSELEMRDSNIAQVAENYACSLGSLFDKQDQIGRQQTVETLSELAKRYDGNVDIAEQYANDLAILSLYQDKISRLKTVETLGKLVKQYDGNVDIAESYAIGLFMLIEDQDLIGRQQTVSLLYRLMSQYDGNEDIVVKYALSLNGLGVLQDQQGREKSALTLRELMERFSDNADIAYAYAEGVDNLIQGQEQQGKEDSIEVLKELADRFVGNERIREVYSRYKA